MYQVNKEGYRKSYVGKMCGKQYREKYLIKCRHREIEWNIHEVKNSGM